FVNGLGDSHGVIRAIELDHIPSGRALDGSGCVLVKVFPLQPELALITARAVAVINAIEIELRRAAAVQRCLDGDAIADFPMEALGRARARDFRAAAEGALHHGKKREQDQSDCKRADRKHEANLLAEQIGEDQAAEFHAAPPAITGCLDFPPSMSTPFSRCSVVCARAATTGSCVTIRIVLLYLPTSSSMSAMISSALLRSRSPVGSSHSRNVGSETIA